MARPDPARGHDDPIHSAFEQQVDVGELALRLIGRVAQEQGETVLVGSVLDGTHDLREVRILDIGH